MEALLVTICYATLHDVTMVPIMTAWHVQGQQRVCPPIFQTITPAEQQTAGSIDRGQSIPVQPKGADPDWLPAANLTRASSEGGEANQGRCKCGEESLNLRPIALNVECCVCLAWQYRRDTVLWKMWLCYSALVFSASEWAVLSSIWCMCVLR